MYLKQKNYWISLLRECKREYYSSLDEKYITINKIFWKILKPNSSEKITLTGNEEIVSSDKITAQIFYIYFSNRVTNLDIPEYYQCEPIAGSIDNSINKSIVKYRSHPSILAIRELCNRGKEFPFAFSQVYREEILQGISHLDILKASQDMDIPTKVIKYNSDV